MGRTPCCDKAGLKKGPWTPEEDQKLLTYVSEHGHGSWRALPAKAGLQRCGKSCRLRWTNYLRPDIIRGQFSGKEEQTIIQLHALLGNRWSAIATHLPRRTDNEIKNYWNTHLKKRLTRMGIDPVTHKPRSEAIDKDACHSKNALNISHMAQWESARLEAEARLARESKSKSYSLQHGSVTTPQRWNDGLKGTELESPSSSLAFSEPLQLPIMTTSAPMAEENSNSYSPLLGHEETSYSSVSDDHHHCKWTPASSSTGSADLLTGNIIAEASADFALDDVCQKNGGNNYEDNSYWNTLFCFSGSSADDLGYVW